ncbi:tetratricopeptide repeat protein [Corynebacterium matruchotii]|uniref:tetratricopeptide repeat protein n=1 Tax=Corynebacterium matruchotii TaxID=43768 RepID=UPI0028E92028|nr:tetratricopeptide repeat protein [Corynebacterium matruchotii]
MGQTPSAQYYHQLIQLRATLGEEHPDTLAAWRDYTTALMDEGDDKTAQPELRRLVAACEQTFGPEHPTTRSNRADWALCLKETNLHLQALEQYLLVADYDDGYDVRFAAVGCFIRLGCFEEAIYLLHAVVRGYAKTLGDQHDLTRLARGTLVFLLAGVHQKEALVEYGRLWGVDKRSMPRPLGILADTRVLLDDITANQPKYIRETFNPVATLPVRNPEFFRFAERLKHREDFYPNLLQRLDPTLKAPTDPSDVPQRRAYCAGLTRIGQIDEAVDEYVKLIDFVAGKYGTQSDLFRSIVLELDWYQLHKSDRHALAMEHVNELRQLSKEQITAGNNQLGQARRTGNWLKTMAQVRKQWGTCRELGTSIPKILDDWWKYIQRTVIGKKSDPAITSRHVCQCLTQWLRFYGCMVPRSRNKCYRYLDYVVRHGYIEEAAALLGPALRLFDGVMNKPDELLLCRSRYLWQLRNQGWLDLAEWEYSAFFEEYVESGINVDGIPYTGYCYCDDHDLEVLLVNIHDGYMKVLCDLGKREKAYDELQRMWNYTDDT